MNGPEHYAEAERLLGLADSAVSANMAASTGESKADVLAAAQVHATLALTAATAYRYASPGTTQDAWRQAIHGNDPPAPDPWRAP